MVILDLRSHNLTGKFASESLERVGITSNKNTVPFDNTSAFITSGVRLGTAACTTRGFKEKEFEIVANLIADLFDSLKRSENHSILEKIILLKVKELTTKFVVYS